jgi:hypothetical protein
VCVCVCACARMCVRARVRERERKNHIKFIEGDSETKFSALGGTR